MRKNMVSFESDYNNGAVPEILERLAKTNDERSSGYGYDRYTESAAKKIALECGLDTVEVSFLVGGTQTNMAVIDSLLLGCQGVICCDTGHIAVHESGAVESCGHKVIALPGKDSKLEAQTLENYLEGFEADETCLHQVQPGMVYISFPTEAGMLYSKSELDAIYNVCKKHGLYLYIDGARLGYALMAPGNDVTLKHLASHCDVFYIGGTKVGALFGEAVVFTNTRAPKFFFTEIKRHGALLAKGRLLGLQFDTLFTDGLYYTISKHAIDCAMQLREIFKKHGFEFGIDSPTNQQFVILTKDQRKALSKKLAFELWSPLEGEKLLCRFVTSWATTAEDLKTLDEALGAL